MTDRRQMRIEHTFTQRYHGWNSWPYDPFEARIGTFDILEHLDTLEREVYRDREYTMANQMLEALCDSNGNAS